jgi:hypothetical protein
MSLTEAGEELLTSADAAVRRIEQTMLRDLGDDQRAALLICSNAARPGLCSAAGAREADTRGRSATGARDDH